jgi:hypothetical protein
LLQIKKIKGLHEDDFIMATKIDRIFARRGRGVNEFCLSCNLRRFFGTHRVFRCVQGRDATARLVGCRHKIATDV